MGSIPHLAGCGRDSERQKLWERLQESHAALVGAPWARSPGHVNVAPNAAVKTPGGPPAAACRVAYAVSTAPTTFTANLTVTNTGASALASWTLGFQFPGSQRVTEGWSATWTQSGANVTATNLSWNAPLGRDQAAPIGFNGSYSGANPNPTAFTLNGTTCSMG